MKTKDHEGPFSTWRINQMNTQKKIDRLLQPALYCVIAGLLVGFGFPKIWLVGFVLCVIAGILVIWAMELRRRVNNKLANKPKFFIFEAGGSRISTSPTVVATLLCGDRSGLSVDERAFLGYCQYCQVNMLPYPWTICHPGISTMSQEKICEYMLDCVVATPPSA